MSYGNRRVNNQNNNLNSRSVSYNGGGGLNERFSRIAKSAAQANNNHNFSNGNNNNNNNSNSNTTKSSVFSRLRGAKSQPRSNIQLRLGKTVGGGIKKKGNKSNVNVVKGISKQSKATGRIAKRVVAAKTTTKKQNTKQQKKPQKKPTAEDLDKALDAYMMKDPKTAQAKLDAELTSYMDEASEILMEEENM